MILVIPPWLDRSVTGAVYGFALLKGGAPERFLGAFFGAVWFWNSFVHSHWFGPRDAYELMIDVTALLLTLAFVLRFDRWWLIVVGVAMVLRVATDIANFLVPLNGWAYGTALMTWGYILLAALAAGAWTSWREQRAATRLASA